MFTFVISLVVVGAALVVATRVALSEAPLPAKPATPAAGRVRGAPAKIDPSLVIVEHESVTASAGQRLRSGLLLVLLVAFLGAVAALVLLVGGAVVLTGLRSAVQ
ncbi:MAG TPA: hypothetical protein VGZ52_12310 [Acidimicrobiales bacterium]|nr:hypothetical protein [Acidimicrobiales bacterium]